MTFEKATVDDIKELTALRIAYLQEDGGAVDEEVLHSIEVALPHYFASHLNNDITAYVARTEEEIVSCALLLVIEKPMSPAFITGKIGNVLNVYTRQEYRHKGYANRLMHMLLKDASDLNLSFVELKATEDGYGLYRSLGFEDEISKYHSMRWHDKKGGKMDKVIQELKSFMNEGNQLVALPGKYKKKLISYY